MNVALIRRLWPVTGQVDRGSVVRSVTATGTMNPVVVAQVGTYDSVLAEAFGIEHLSAVAEADHLAPKFHTGGDVYRQFDAAAVCAVDSPRGRPSGSRTKGVTPVKKHVERVNPSSR